MTDNSFEGGKACMSRTHGAPPRAGEIREVVHERVEEAKQSNGEKITVDWRGEPRHLYVIQMPVNLLYYNPETHRIRAQRSLDPDRDAALDQDPWGAPGQAYLDFLLKCLPADPDKIDPDFEALRDDLESFSQRDPGLITDDGILVNGNTRCAALRELGETHIRVGVLPTTSDWDDINAVELSLQLQTPRKRDYSYINRLIAIEEQLRLGRRPEDIARQFRIKQTTLEQDRWVYQLIQDAIQRSRTSDGAQLRLLDFEDHQEKLRELHRTYMKVAATDQDAAETLKEVRLAMIILGNAKTDVRLAQSDFLEKYLEPKLPDSLKSSASEMIPVTIPGLSGVAAPAPSAALEKAKALTNDLLKAKAVTGSDSKADPAATKSAVLKLNEARDAVDRALKPAGRDESLRQRKLAAPDRLSDACDDIELCAIDLAESRAKRAIDEEAFDDAVVRLRTAIAKLAKEARRTFSEPGDGVDWLLSIAEDTVD